MLIRQSIYFLLLTCFILSSCEKLDKSNTDKSLVDSVLKYRKMECYINPVINGKLTPSQRFLWGSRTYDDNGNIIEQTTRINTLTDTLVNGLMIYQKKYEGKTVIESTESYLDFYKEVTRIENGFNMEIFRYDKLGLFEHIVNERVENKWTKCFINCVINGQEALFETVVFRPSANGSDTYANPNLDPQIRKKYLDRKDVFRIPSDVHPSPNPERIRTFTNIIYNLDTTVKSEDMYFVSSDNKLEELIGNLEFIYYK